MRIKRGKKREKGEGGMEGDIERKRVDMTGLEAKGKREKCRKSKESRMTINSFVKKPTKKGKKYWRSKTLKCKNSKYTKKEKTVINN